MIEAPVPVFGLTPDGFVPMRANDIVSQLQSDYEALSGTTPDWTPDTGDIVLQNVFAVASVQGGNAWEAIGAVYDARSPNNATGVQLDDIKRIIGVTRRAATYSEVTLTLTGTAGTVLLAGRIVQGGGTDGTAQWTTTNNVTIGGGGTATIVATCTVAGAVPVPSGTVSIVTPQIGWTAASAGTPSSVGQDYQSDADYRLQGPVGGSRSLDAIRTAIVAIDPVTNEPPTGCTAAVVVDNPTNATVTVSGITLNPFSVSVIVSPNTLTATQQNVLANLLYSYVDQATYMNGSVVKQVTGGDGFSKTVRWDYCTTTAVTVVVTVVLKTGFGIGDVTAPIQAAVAAYFAALRVGESAIPYQIGVLCDVDGVKSITSITLNGGGEIDPNLDVLLTLAAPATVTT